ncbi:hypothetical protein NM208_g3817 [Fusarium decemcellulare]|uniref:Uncharacterized protein n=1 Tax=Fusarium decemcellulare TaxID=57161 RepID=A0ACC1SMU5_9HYPO|nr:hypothetical protein NM208_g3817 [Fusarium decemcellulare]
MRVPLPASGLPPPIVKQAQIAPSLGVFVMGAGCIGLFSVQGGISKAEITQMITHVGDYGDTKTAFKKIKRGQTIEILIASSNDGEDDGLLSAEGERTANNNDVGGRRCQSG